MDPADKEALYEAFERKAMYMAEHVWVNKYLDKGVERWKDMDHALRMIEKKSVKLGGTKGTDLRILLDAL